MLMEYYQQIHKAVLSWAYGEVIMQQNNMIVRQKIKKEAVVKRQETQGNQRKKYGILQGEVVCKQNSFSFFKATNLATNELVTIKVFSEQITLKCDKDLRFSRQLPLLKKLNHPTLVNQLDYYKENNRWHLVSEQCNEGALSSLIRQTGQLDQVYAKNYIISILQGLIYLEEHGIMHKDIKPSNILISNGKAKISGFGFEQLVNQTCDLFGEDSYFYMSPQRFILHEQEPKSIVWTFGVIIYEMLHGKTPFLSRDESQFAFALMKQVDASIFASHISEELKEVILSCLVIDVEKRVRFKQLQSFKYFSAKFNGRQSQINSGKSEDLQWRYLLNQFNDDQLLLQEKEEDLNLLKIETKNKQKVSRVTLRATSLETQIKKNQLLTSDDQLFLESLTIRIHKIQSTPEIKIPGSSQLKNLIAGPLTESQVVKLTNYCRLIYKSIQLIRSLQIKQERQLIVMQSWLLLFLESLLCKVQQPKDLKSLQNQKLKKVIQGYLSKYASQFPALGNYRADNQITYKKINSYFQSIRERLLAQINQLLERQKLVLSHYIVIISHITQILQKCYVRKDYTLLDGVHEMERAIKMSTNAKNTKSLQFLVRQYAL